MCVWGGGLQALHGGGEGVPACSWRVWGASVRSGIFDACRRKLGPMFLSSHLGEAFSSVNPASAVGTGMVRKVRCGMHQLGPLLPLLSSLLPSGTSFSTCLLLPPHPTSPPLLSPPQGLHPQGPQPTGAGAAPHHCSGPGSRGGGSGPFSSSSCRGSGGRVRGGGRSSNDSLSCCCGYGGMRGGVRQRVWQEQQQSPWG